MAKKNAETAIAKQDPAELTGVDAPFSMERPDWLDAADTRGTENIDTNDVKLPRILICQDLTPQRKRSDPKFIDGLTELQMFNDLNEHVYGQGPITIVPIRMDKRAIEWHPRDGALKGMKDANVPWDDPRCEFTDGVKDGQPVRQKPAATRYYEFLVYVVETNELAVLSMKGTQIKVAKTFNSFIRKYTPAFSMAYALAVVEDQKDQYKFGNYKVQPAGYVRDKALALELERTYEAMKDKNIVVDRDDEDVTEQSAGDGGHDAEVEEV